MMRTIIRKTISVSTGLVMGQIAKEIGTVCCNGGLEILNKIGIYALTLEGVAVGYGMTEHFFDLIAEVVNDEADDSNNDSGV